MAPTPNLVLSKKKEQNCSAGTLLASAEGALGPPGGAGPSRRGAAVQLSCRGPQGSSTARRLAQAQMATEGAFLSLPRAALPLR